MEKALCNHCILMFANRQKLARLLHVKSELIFNYRTIQKCQAASEGQERVWLWLEKHTYMHMFTYTHSQTHTYIYIQIRHNNKKSFLFCKFKENTNRTRTFWTAALIGGQRAIAEIGSAGGQEATAAAKVEAGRHRKLRRGSRPAACWCFRHGQSKRSGSLASLL